MNDIEAKALEEELYKEAFNKAIDDMESTKPGAPNTPAVEDSSVGKDNNGVAPYTDTSEWNDKDTAQTHSNCTGYYENILYTFS